MGHALLCKMAWGQNKVWLGHDVVLAKNLAEKNYNTFGDKKQIIKQGSREKFWLR